MTGRRRKGVMGPWGTSVTQAWLQGRIAFKQARNQTRMGVDNDVAVNRAMEASFYVLSFWCLAIVGQVFGVFLLPATSLSILWMGGMALGAMWVHSRLRTWLSSRADTKLVYGIPTGLVVGLWVWWTILGWFPIVCLAIILG